MSFFGRGRRRRKLDDLQGSAAAGGGCVEGSALRPLPRANSVPAYEASETPASTRRGAGAVVAEASRAFTVYLCPLGDAPTSRTSTVRMQVSRQDLESLATQPRNAPPLVTLDELTGCFYDVRFVPAGQDRVVACATYSRRNEL